MLYSYLLLFFIFSIIIKIYIISLFFSKKYKYLDIIHFTFIFIQLQFYLIYLVQISQKFK